MRLPFLLSRHRVERLLGGQARGYELVIRKIGEQHQERHDLVAEQLADVSIVNDCLTRDLLTSRRQRVIARKAGARILAAWAAEKRRADRLQQRLDDAVGLPAGRITDSGPWQPAYVEPKADTT
jgi:hypothetical protein